MFVYALTEPIDLFDGLIPLTQWISGEGDHSDAPISWLLEYSDHHAEVEARDIGPSEHTTQSDIPADIFTGQQPTTLTHPGQPSF